MQNWAATIQCSNPHCQAKNPGSNQLCHQCRTPLVKRYLWMLGVAEVPIGELIGERYRLEQPRVVLDTQPGLPPQVPSDIPEAIASYLRLFPYRLHVPQVYGVIDPQASRQIWLLEYGTVPTDALGRLKNEQITPKLDQVWQQTTALRQLNWLWQIATLWQPLHSQKVASSLLNPTLLRVNGGIIQLLQLQPDEQTPTLKQLGQLWSEWIDKASVSLTQFLQQLCEQLIEGRINQPEPLLAILEQGLRQSGQNSTRTYQIYTATDTGPQRDHNEDACYPVAGQLVESQGGLDSLTIVCDGLGGQDGGEIASQLAIQALPQAVKALASNISSGLEQALYNVNDLISQHNDQEQRHEQQRMGTTVVMTLAWDQEMYLSHVGDSRIYRITANGCHQVTVDDDVASQEVRLGSAIYRNAIRSPHTGALLQALGIDSSTFLHPTVQRLVLDEDCVFLLCSDGLSDGERVEQYWGEIVPILQHRGQLETVGKRLLTIANGQNGHDNVTIALVYCQVHYQEASLSSIAPPVLAQPTTEVALASPPPSPKPKRLWLGIAFVCFLCLGAVGYFLFQSRERLEPPSQGSSQLSLGRFLSLEVRGEN